ncbi:MAG: phosphoenolpyruvate synthase, partial [Proteobacteria bacterium]
MTWTMTVALDASHPEKPFELKNLPSIIDERLSLEAFSQLAGSLAGHPFVKVVVDREEKHIHFLNHAAFPFHSDYIGTHIINTDPARIDAEIDRYNQLFYHDPTRRFYLCVLALHRSEERRFFSLETVEVDSMSVEQMKEMYTAVREMTDPTLPLFVKPANHIQEAYLSGVDPHEIPRIHGHELFATAQYVALNSGQADGRIRAFADEQAYVRERASVQWYDIIVMPKVPEDIPRLMGIINAEHTTPLSHTNVLAAGWQIPNCIQLGILDRIAHENLDGEWVRYTVTNDLSEAKLERTGARDIVSATPPWQHTRVVLEAPETQNGPIVALDKLRMSDRNQYGTKAANLGELNHILAKGSERLVGFYKIPRPPRANLIPYLAQTLGVPESANMGKESGQFIRKHVKLPRGVAIPFSMQSRFLESSPRIQQMIGKLKMALELNARQVEPLCVELQNLILATKFPETLREEIDLKIAEHLAGVSNFVVRSSSNAEDLANFSAAGIYESVNHVSTSDKILE